MNKIANKHKVPHSTVHHHTQHSVLGVQARSGFEFKRKTEIMMVAAVVTVIADAIPAAPDVMATGKSLIGSLER